MDDFKEREDTRLWKRKQYISHSVENSRLKRL